MISTLDYYFARFVEDLIFINIEAEKLKSDFGIQNKDVLLPIKKSELINMAKAEYQSFSSKQIIDGIICIMGADPSFKWNLEYNRFLKEKIANIEKVVKSDIAEDIKEKRLFQAALKLRAYINFINKQDNEANLYYASVCKEIYVNSSNKKDMKAFYEEARYYFEEANRIDSKNVLAAFELAYFNLSEERLDDAKSLMEVVVAYTNDKDMLEDATNFLENLDIGSTIDKGEKLLEEGKTIEALKLFLKVNPTSSSMKYKWLFNKGVCYKMLGDADMALENYEEAVQINNMDPMLLAELGMIYGYLGEFDQSLEFYYSALNLEPKNIAILCNLGMILMNIGDLERSREYINKALEVDDKDEIAISCLKELRKFE